MNNFLHSGNIGDIIYALPCCLGLGTPFEMRLALDVPANYYPGAKHPCGSVRMNRKAAEALLPLLNYQDYMTAEIWNEDLSQVTHNLDMMRRLNIHFASGYIPRWYFWTFPSFYDLTLPWIKAEKIPGFEDTIVVNRTQRYQNKEINYKCLENYQTVFVGLEEEYKECGFKTDWVETKDLAHLAAIINSCRLYVGNQSVSFAIAEALKVPRLLEVCNFAPNVIPHGPLGTDAVNPLGFERTLERWVK